MILSSKLQLIRTRAKNRLAPLLNKMTVAPQNSGIIVRLYRLMEDVEARLMNDQINSRNDVQAWYSPTAFWPQFNKVRAPRLTCVPDVSSPNSRSAFLR
jgi:hypothetical protein